MASHATTGGILFLHAAAHGYTLDAVLHGRDGMPPIRRMTYDAAFRARRMPRLTTVFTDLERLTAHERLLACELRAGLQAAGMRCLNDPARVPTRHGLLVALARAGINPFRSWRADEFPQPGRFPVFLRVEADHRRPVSELLPDQAALDAALAALPARGLALSGVLVMEYCAEPIAPGVWRKCGTFRIGDALSTDHAVIEDEWCVKYGRVGLATEAMMQQEHDDVAANRFAEPLRAAFDIAGIEWGRADHATVAGQEVVYEINTNPSIGALAPQRLPVRDRTLAISRARMAALLHNIAAGDGRGVPIESGEALREWRRNSRWTRAPYRP
jgi:hypothetical protein